jgi:undecaprenyl-diphosphatase
MVDLLWAWIQPQGAFFLTHIAAWIVAVWMLFWFLLWRFSQPILKHFRQTVSCHRLDNFPFPRLIRLLCTRFDNQHLIGLPLTLAVAVFFALALLLSGVVEDVVERDFIVQFDHWMATSMAQAHTEFVVSVFHTITIFGNTNIIVPLWIITLITLSVWGNRFLALPLFISFIGSMGMSSLGKYVFARPRPIEALFVEHSLSFPSGHSTLAMSFYAVCFYLLWRHSTGWNRQVLVAFSGISFILLLSSSRIIIGVHYFSDVLAGLLLGSLWFVIAISLYEWLSFKKYINFKGDK